MIDLQAKRSTGGARLGFNVLGVIVAVAVVVVALGALVVLGAIVLRSRQSEDRATVCTQEAKLCPDGSYVSRTGPKCEFTVCPSVAPCDGGACPEKKTKNSAAIDTSGWKTYRNEEYGFEVRHPSNWLVMSYSQHIDEETLQEGRQFRFFTQDGRTATFFVVFSPPMEKWLTIDELKPDPLLASADSKKRFREVSLKGSVGRILTDATVTCEKNNICFSTFDFYSDALTGRGIEVWANIGPMQNEDTTSIYASYDKFTDELRIMYNVLGTMLF